MLAAHAAQSAGARVRAISRAAQTGFGSHVEVFDSTVDALAGADLVIEAVFENMAIKKEIFTKLDAIVKPGAILASNTSYLDIDEIAAVTQRPGDVVGLHFFSPANVMRATSRAVSAR